MIMKKFAFIIGLIVTVSFGFSQNSKVVSAYNYNNDGKLAKAKENIDAATVHVKTMGNAKTWFYRGKIYLNIYNSQDSIYKNLDPDALPKSYEAFKKAQELDTKKQYMVEILTLLPAVGESYFNFGAKKYNDGMTALNARDSVLSRAEFKNSVTAFETAYTIYEGMGRVDTTTIYYMSVAAELGEDYDKAINNLETLIEMDYPESGIYSSAGNIYYDHFKDAEKAAAVFSAGREKFPDDLSLLLNETNFFLAEEQTEKALNNLQLAAKIDETNPTIFFAIGAKYNEVVDDTTKTDEMREGAFEDAAEAYKKSIEIKPDYFDPNYNMGALYVNKAAGLIEVANDLPLDQQAKYDSLKSEANQYLGDCLPYLEKARELEPEDRSTLVSLKEIYTRLKMYDELKEIDAKLEE
jgi:hypothetical protein